jgi:uncharacterized OsmC-like protein
LKRLLMNSFPASSVAACEGYTMSKIVDKKMQSKVKKFRSELNVDKLIFGG